MTSPEMSAVGAGAQVVCIALTRMAAFGGFSSLYVLTAETFPTPLRATAFGVVSGASRLAGTASPFVAGTLWDTSPAAALFSYAAAATLCAVAVRGFVTDTGQRPMPDEVSPLVPPHALHEVVEDAANGHNATCPRPFDNVTAAPQASSAATQAPASPTPSPPASPGCAAAHARRTPGPQPPQH